MKSEIFEEPHLSLTSAFLDVLNTDRNIWPQAHFVSLLCRISQLLTVNCSMLQPIPEPLSLFWKKLSVYKVEVDSSNIFAKTCTPKIHGFII